MSQHTQDPGLRAALEAIAKAIKINDTDTLSRISPDRLVIWTASGSWTGSASVTLGHLRAIAALSATPAHAPGKAGDQEGLEAGRTAYAAYARSVEDYEGSPDKQPAFGEWESVKPSIRRHWAAVEAALAPSPTGNEASRGENDGLRSKAADEVEGIAGLWEGDGRSYAMTIAAILRSEEPAELPPADEETKRIVTRAWERFQRGVAPPPPVSTEPDSRAGAEREARWGIEDTGEMLWVGPMRPDGRKVDRIVYYKHLSGYKQDYVDRAKFEARLVVTAVNAALHPSPPTASGAAPPVGDGYEVLATIYDGTKILAPKHKSDRFTTQEIRDAVMKHFETITPTPAPHPVPEGQTTGEV
ncbi:hypothetical protein [Methylobacterium flocculans]|uniref:hypothetical protein n=1 Tax=Methylobacterium flocculans TaxID=2984843 RepID=UPI0021F36BA3|nr:hypothetical protein [Methylobacterium sp. FF17]